MKITKIRDLILCRVWWIQSKTVHTPSVSVCVCLALVRFWAEMNCAKLLNIGASGTGISTSGLVSASRALNSLEVKSNSGFVFSILSTILATILFTWNESRHERKIELVDNFVVCRSARLPNCEILIQMLHIFKKALWISSCNLYRFRLALSNSYLNVFLLCFYFRFASLRIFHMNASWESP